MYIDPKVNFVKRLSLSLYDDGDFSSYRSICFINFVQINLILNLQFTSTIKEHALC